VNTKLFLLIYGNDVYCVITYSLNVFLHESQAQVKKFALYMS